MSNGNDPLTPVEVAMARKKRWRLAIILLLLAAAIYYLFFVNQYVVAFRDDEDHFLHGSIGSETATGPPYWVFKALPVMYADKLGPKGWARFGFLYENASDDLPLGISRRVVSGVERVWLNCAVCHVGSYRLPGSAERKFIYGAPSNNLRFQKFVLFLIEVGQDPGFNADALIAAIRSPQVGGHLNFFERLIYRYVVFPRVKGAFLELNDSLDFVKRQEDWGPGRVDTFNPYKSLQFNFPMGEDNITNAALNGTSDYPSIWRQHVREGMDLHWDGNNDSLAERNLSAALGAGVTPVTVDRRAVKRIAGWIADLPAPVFPAEFKLDQAKIKQGKSLFERHCADCHGLKTGDGYDYDTDQFRGLGRTVALAKIGTDPGRWESYTENFAAAQNLLYAGTSMRFTRFHKTDGYASQPLDGIWARSPYLHNGSVPTLRDLLEPGNKRPAKWLRGSEELDPVNVGYRSDAAAPGDDLFVYDTSRPGNSNRGHEGRRYGTQLPEADKDALVEYMKTL